MLNEQDVKNLQELESKIIAEKMLRHELGWQVDFDERQRRLIAHCRVYARSDPAGLPSHNLMLIIDKMARLLDDHWSDESSKKEEGDCVRCLKCDSELGPGFGYKVGDTCPECGDAELVSAEW